MENRASGSFWCCCGSEGTRGTNSLAAIFKKESGQLDTEAKRLIFAFLLNTGSLKSQSLFKS